MEYEKEASKESEDVQKTNIAEALKIVRDTKKELADYRRPFEADWKKFDQAYYGKQHKTGESVKTTKNHIFKIVESEIPMLTDSLSSTQLTASREDKQRSAEVLEKAIKYVYQDQNLPILTPSLLRSASMSAPGYLYAFYNPDAECGNGKIEYKQLPWESVYLDGNAQTIEQSENCRIEINMRKESIIRTWPEFEKQIKELTPENSFGNETDDNFEKRDISGNADQAMGKPNRFKSKEILTYAETWVKDYSLKDIDPEETKEEIDEVISKLRNGDIPEAEKWENHDEIINAVKALRGELLSVVNLPADAEFEEIQSQVDQLLAQNPQAGDLSRGLFIIKIIDNHIEQREELKKLNPTSQEPKFEDGWRVIKSVGNVVLYDGPNPEEGGEIPLVPFYCYKDDTIYGFGLIKNIFSIQQTLNDVDYREFTGLKVVSNPGWIADYEAEVKDTDLTNEPGIVVTKKRGTEVRRLEPGQVSPQLDQRKRFDQQSMESIEGMNEQSMNGAMLVGNASGVAVQKIQTQPIGRIRLKGRNLEYYSMRRLAIITANLILNHWTDEKILRLRADDNSIEEVIYNPIEMEELEYMVDVTPGSMAGIDKDQLIAFYMGLLNQQHIDFETFLAASPEFPGKHTLVKMFKKKDQQNNQIKQAQQQYEGMIQQQQAQLQDAKSQNIKLRGLLESGRTVTADMLTPEEKRVFEQHGKQAVLNSVLQEHQQEQYNQEQMGNMEPMMANQNNQEM